MHVLAIMGSPRKKGNTFLVTKKVEQLLLKKEDITFEYLHLKDYTLKNCIGCHNCLFKGENTCPLNDDRDTILSKMKQADAVIFTSPTYVMNITALMKNFIDHFAYLCHRPIFFKKHTLVIATTGGMGEKETLKHLKTPAATWGFHISGAIALRTPPVENVQKLIDKHTTKIEQKVQRFYKHISSDKTPSPTLFSLIQFSIFKQVSFAQKETLQADYQFYKKRHNKDFYEDLSINPLKKWFAKFLSKIVIQFTFT